jgi:hypothetical protein
MSILLLSNNSAEQHDNSGGTARRYGPNSGGQCWRFPVMSKSVAARSLRSVGRVAATDGAGFESR